MNTLYLAWQDTESRRWFPIGRLTYNDCYRFVYVQGVRQAREISGFEPLPSFPQLEQEYTATELFPLFANRVMPMSRPDFPQYADWLELSPSDKDPLAYLAGSGGRRATDTFEVFPAPRETGSGGCIVSFFAHGLRHMAPDSVHRAEQLQAGETLRLMWDAQNRYDCHAVQLKTCLRDSGDAALVGYCPRYLAGDIMDALRRDPASVICTVTKINPAPAPMQFRLLCQLEFTAGSVTPFTGSEYTPIARVSGV